jgi:hypothetical protein
MLLDTIIRTWLLSHACAKVETAEKGLDDSCNIARNKKVRKSRARQTRK